MSSFRGERERERERECVALLHFKGRSIRKITTGAGLFVIFESTIVYQAYKTDSIVKKLGDLIASTQYHMKGAP